MASSLPSPNPGGGFVDPEKVKKVTEFVNEYKKKIEDTIRPIKDLTDGVKKFLDAGNQIPKITEHLKGLSASGAAAAMSLVEGLKSFARAGLEGTGVAAMLHFQTQQLARGVAAVFLPAVEAAVDVVRRLSDWFHGLTEGQQNAIQGLVVGAAAAKVMSGAMAALGVESAIATGGLSLLAGVVAAVAAGGGGGLGKLGDAFSSLLDTIKPVLDIVSDLFDSLVDAIQPAIQAVAGALSPAIDVLAGVFGNLMQDLQPFISLMAGQLVQTVRMVGEVLKGLGPILGLLESVFAAQVEQIAPVIELMNGLANAALGLLAGGLSKIAPLVEVVAEAIDAMTEGFRAAIEIASALWDVFKEGVSVVLGAFDGLGDGIREFLGDVWQGMLKAIEMAIDGMLRWAAIAKSVAAWIKDGFRGSLDDAIKGAAAEYLKLKEHMAERKENREGHRHGRLDKPGRQVGFGGGSFEDISAAFSRIQQAAYGGGGKSKEDEIADNTKRAADALDDLAGKKDKPKGNPAPPA